MEIDAIPDSAMAVFDNYNIRRNYDDKTETWYFSVVDIIAALLQQSDHQKARKYWNKLKERLKKEGSESVTNCHRLKLIAADGKKYLTDVANPETLLRLLQSVPNPDWIAKELHKGNGCYLLQNSPKYSFLNNFLSVTSYQFGKQYFISYTGTGLFVGP